MLQVGDEMVVKAVRIQDEDPLVVDAQLIPGQHFEEFIQRTESTRQDDGGIAFFVDGSFPFMHVAGDDQLRKSLMLMFAVAQDDGDHPSGMTTCGEMPVGHCPHQAFSTSAIYDVDAGLHQALTQGPGIDHVGRIASGSGGTENGDGANPG